MTTNPTTTMTTIPNTNYKVELNFAVNEARPKADVMRDFSVISILNDLFPNDETIHAIHDILWNTAYELSERDGDFTEFDKVNLSYFGKLMAKEETL